MDCYIGRQLEICLEVHQVFHRPAAKEASSYHLVMGLALNKHVEGQSPTTLPVAWPCCILHLISCDLSALQRVQTEYDKAFGFELT